MSKEPAAMQAAPYAGSADAEPASAADLAAVERVEELVEQAEAWARFLEAEAISDLTHTARMKYKQVGCLRSLCAAARRAARMRELILEGYWSPRMEQMRDKLLAAIAAELKGQR